MADGQNRREPIGVLLFLTLVSASALPESFLGGTGGTAITEELPAGRFGRRIARNAPAAVGFTLTVGEAQQYAFVYVVKVVGIGSSNTTPGLTSATQYAVRDGDWVHLELQSLPAYAPVWCAPAGFITSISGDTRPFMTACPFPSPSSTTRTTVCTSARTGSWTSCGATRTGWRARRGWRRMCGLRGSGRI